MFIRGSNPIWSEFNTVGELFTDAYYAFFLSNDLPYNFQTVYQDPNGLVPWSNPIEFQPNGTLLDNLYFNPNLVYRIEFREGPNQTSPLIGNPIQNYVPGSGTTISSNPSETAVNIVTNPQFSDINFLSPLSISVAGTYNVAPGWQLVLTGIGSATVTQELIDGNTDLLGNPPYALNIVTAGFTTAQLIQQLGNNGAIFGGGGITVAFTAEATGSNETLTVSYVPSTGASTNIFQGIIAAGSFIPYTGFANLPDSTSTDTGTAAYVNIIFNLQGTGNITLTNIQITGQSLPFPDTFQSTDVPEFQELSYPQILNQEFNIFKAPLFYKQIPSYLVGWDFPLNPAQFLGKSVAAQAVGANKSYYVWDQTILFQSHNSGITTSSGPAGDLKLVAASTGQLAVIQYLDQIQARKILNDYISVNLSALSSVAGGGGIKTTISLWYSKGSALPSCVGSNLSIVATLDANGKPATFNQPTGGNWIEVAPLNGQEAVCTVLGSSTTNFNDYSFNGYWDLSINADANLATFFAIVIGTASVTAADYIRINSVGLSSGKIATRPASQTQDQVLRECQYYYEKSYDPGVLPGATTKSGQIFNNGTIYSSTINTFCYFGNIYWQFKQQKNIAPTITFYSPVTGSSGNVHVDTWVGTSYTDTGGDQAISNWGTNASNLAVISTSNAYYPSASVSQATTAPGSVNQSTVGEVLYHYVADSRLAQ